MDDWKIELTQEAIEDPQGAIQALIEAANNICADSQQDFQALKDTKWYKRLWNLITFSKDNEKKLARGVSNLAKLQEIVMKALLLLVSSSAETAEIVKQNSIVLDELSKKLTVTKNAQVGIIRELERIKSGVATSLSFEEISANTKLVVVNALFALAESVSQKTALGQEYLSAMMRTAHCTSSDIQDGINFDYMGDFKSKESQLVYSMAMEYLFLATGGFAYDSDIVECISISKRNAEAICMQIERTVNILGAESLLNRFEDDSEYIFVADDFVEWFVEEEEPETEDVVPVIEVLNIDNMVHIAAGTTVAYQYKEIHLKSLINCSGVLQFDNCVIVYNENENSDEIILNDGAELYATNCVFKCRNIDDNHFISLANDCRASFDKCMFVDCSYFLLSEKDGSTLSITNSEFYNCAAFVKHGYSAGAFRLMQSNISLDKNWVHDKKYGSNNLFAIDCNDARVENVVVSSTAGNTPELFAVENGTIINSSFEGIRGDLISAQIVENCVFENCFGTYHLIKNYLSHNGKRYIKSCVFENCREIIMAGSNTIITQCKFVSCSDSLIRGATSDTGIEISYCEFINYKNTATDERQGKDTSDPVSAIKLYAEKRKTGSVIKKCVFDGIDINEGFLISPDIIGKLSGNTITVIDCDFRNCSTKRHSGKIIKTYGYYLSLFDSVKNELAIIVENCRGLDKVKQGGNGVCADQTVLTKVTTAKANIGAKAIAAAGIGIVGGPLALAGVAVLNAITDKQKKKDAELSAQASKE